MFQTEILVYALIASMYIGLQMIYYKLCSIIKLGGQLTVNPRYGILRKSHIKTS